MEIEVGKKIRKLRELKSFTQEHMATQLGVSQSTYSRYESEDGDVTLQQLKNISDILGVKISDLLAFDEKNIFNNYGDSKDSSFLVLGYNNVSPRERELYDKTIKLLEEKVAMLEKAANSR